MTTAQDDPQGDTAITPLASVPDPTLPSGSSVATVLVEIPPGSAGTGPHRHPGPVFGYLIEGAMLFEVDGAAPREIRAGEAFSEPGGDPVHWQAANPSDEDWTRFVAMLVIPPGEEVLTYLTLEEIEERQATRHPDARAAPSVERASSRALTPRGSQQALD